jgi:dephospho-CoA kinase
MLLIGLTGSIATGKTTVSTLLSSPPYSLPIIDADLLAREVVEPGTPAYQKIVNYFLPSTPDLLLNPSATIPAEGVNGKGRPLNRPALGRRIFGDSEERKRDRGVLNSIVHPAVRWAMARAILRAYLQGHWAVVLDVPLLFESGLDVFCGTVMVVGVRDPDVQLKRLLGRDKSQGGNMTEQEARDRVGSQGDVRVKAKRAEQRGKGWGEVVWNDGGREELEGEVRRVMERVRSANPKWWAWLLLLCPPSGAGCAVLSYLTAQRKKKAWEQEELAEKAKL